MIAMCPTGQIRRAVSNRTISRKGFVLLELLITTVVIAVGMAVLITAFSRGIFTSEDAAALRIATALSQAKMEQLRDSTFASIVNEARAPVTGFSGFDRQVVVTSSPGGTNANFKQVDVTIYWNTKGGELSTTLTTYVTNHS